MAQTPQSEQVPRLPHLLRLGQYERSLLWLVVFFGLYLALHGVRTELRLLTAFNASGLLYLALTWREVTGRTADELRAWATRPVPGLLRRQPWLDFWLLGGRTGLAFVLTASVYGVLVTALLLPLRAELGLTRAELLLFVASCLLCVVLSWLVAHLAFALHYAYLHYRAHGRGLHFPDDDPPDLQDFAYFALTVGTTFATSDVNVVSKEVRRVVLRHTVFAFAFNTAILALTLQFAAG